MTLIIRQRLINLSRGSIYQLMLLRQSFVYNFQSTDVDNLFTLSFRVASSTNFVNETFEKSLIEKNLMALSEVIGGSTTLR